MVLGLVFSIMYNNMMKIIKENWYKVIIISYILVVPFFALAQVPPAQESSGKIINPIEVDTFDGVIGIFLEGALKLGIPVVAIAIIYCGFLFVSARGNPESITKAKDALLYTLIGAAILIGAMAIAKMISNTVTSITLL